MSVEWTVGNLSAATQSVFGKYDEKQGVMPLWRHLSDSAAVAGKLWDVWLPAQAKRVLGAQLPEGEADARRLCVWLAGIHDIGKASPAFVHPYESVVAELSGHGLELDPRVSCDAGAALHALAGQLLLHEWLKTEFGWPPGAARQFGTVVGGHHGVPPTRVELHKAKELGYLLGDGPKWRQTHRELLDWAADNSGVKSRLSAWRTVELPQTVQALLTGLVMIADWLASNPDLFPFQGDTAGRLEHAWAKIAPAAPLRVATVPDGIAPPDPDTGSLESKAVDLARQMPAAGLMIVEAPADAERTSAGLAVAQTLAARSGAGGFLLALSTRPTGGQPVDQAKAWLAKIPGVQIACHLDDSDGKRRREGEAELADGLAHVDTDGKSLVTRKWVREFRAMMHANVVVDDIDQVLFAALRTGFLAVRHLALAGKVVVIDEARAYDVHVSQYLDRALEWLGGYGVPVVLLSAALPAKRRRELMAAYDDGRFGATPASLDASELDCYRGLSEAAGYPMLSASQPGREPVVLLPGTGPAAAARTATVERLDEDLELLAKRLSAELAAGGRALVVRNSVSRVHETAERLRGLLPDIPVSVAHSAYLKHDREAKEDWLRETHNGAGPTDSAAKSIVVSDRVVERFSDLDFDLLVSDPAPVDVLLRRIALLHRRDRDDRPETLRSRRCLLTGVDWSMSPPEPVAEAVASYGSYVLLRTLSALWPDGGADPAVALPDDDTLVQAVYRDDAVEPEWWQEAVDAAWKAETAARSVRERRADVFRISGIGRPGDSLAGWLRAEVGPDDPGKDLPDRAHVRPGGEIRKAVVLQWEGNNAKVLKWLPGHGGTEISISKTLKMDKAKVLVGHCVVPIPEEWSTEDLFMALRDGDRSPDWSGDRSLSGLPVLLLDADLRAEPAGYRIDYDAQDGLRVRRAK